MTYFFLALSLCIACTQVPVAKRVTDRERAGLVGPVKKVLVERSPTFSLGGAVPPGSRCRSMTDVYDEGSRLVQHSIYTGYCGEDELRQDFTYARDGSQTNKVQMITGKGSVPPPPPPAALLNSKEVGDEPRVVFKYDSSGRLTEEYVTKPGGRVTFKTTYSYDARGRVVETASGNEEGGVARRVYSYSGDARVPSGFTHVGGDGKVDERTVYSDYEFNSRGDWIKRKEMVEETPDRRIFSWVYREIEYFPSGR